MDDSNDPIKWHLLQCFGGDTQDTPNDTPSADIVSACQFDTGGEHLAAGDRGGRIVVWEREPNPRPRRGGYLPPIEFRFYCEFQSHDPEFDCLRSVEIEERISNIQWLNWNADGKFMLSSNDKTIKLWKIYERNFMAPLDDEMSYSPNNNNNNNDNNGGGVVKIPKLSPVETATVARPRGIFSNAHAFNINSISPSCDGETFLSADDLRIHLWNVHVQHTTMNIVDRKPENMSELNEVITCAAFHPTNPSEFSYSTSVGTVNLCDLRMASSCDTPAKVFRYQEPVQTIFTELISSISDLKYQPLDGRKIITRDYMTLKIWDTAMEREPVAIVRVHDNFRGKLDQLYENDCVFDKFKCAVSNDGSYVLTGSYNNMFHIFGSNNNAKMPLEATTRRKKKKKHGEDPTPTNNVSTPDDFTKKGLLVDWHPKLDVIAVCTTSNLFIFSGERRDPAVGSLGK